MHSNLTPFLAEQRVADLHEQAAKYRTRHPSQPDEPPAPPPAHRHLNLVRLVTRTVHRRRTA